jgi:hypothetical protein
MSEQYDATVLEVILAAIARQNFFLVWVIKVAPDRTRNGA